MKRSQKLSVAAIIILSVVFWSIGCSDKAEYEQYIVAVDSTALSTPLLIKEMQLVVTPPADWLIYDSALTEQFRQMLADAAINRQFAVVYPVAVFVDTMANSMMYVARVNDSKSTFKDLNDNYYEFLKDNAGTSALEKKALDINGLRVGQYLLRSSDVINYKLLGEVSVENRFLIEYIVGARFFKDAQTAVYSSMAMLRAAPASNK